MKTFYISLETKKKDKISIKKEKMMVDIDKKNQDIIKTEYIDHKSGTTILEYQQNGLINFKKNIYNPYFPCESYDISGFIVPGKINNYSIEPRACIKLQCYSVEHTFILGKENKNPIDKIIKMDFKQADKIFKKIDKQQKALTNKAFGSFGSTTIAKIKDIFSNQRW